MLAGKGDVILVAGKGHETYQEINGVKHHFDDREELRAALLTEINKKKCFIIFLNILNELNVPGAGMFHYISFRSAMAVITSLIISLLIGKRIINYLQKKQVGEVVRDLGLEGQYQKKGTPSMGGIIILASIIIPTLVICKA